MSWISSTFSKDGKYSSKRIFGGAGVVTVLFCLVKCTFDHVGLPSGTDIVFGGSITLLGCDSVMSAISKKFEAKNTNSEEISE